MDPDKLIRAACAVEIPAGEFRFRPHDGRGPYFNADAVVAATRSLRLDLPIDYEHQLEHKKTNGQPAPAAGWIKRAFAKAGEVRGEVEWTERAAAMIRAKEYRFHSPVFLHDKSMKVVAVTQAALTNDPAMFMSALAKAQAAPSTSSETDMDPKALRTALGLSAEATDEQVIAAAKAATEAVGGLKTVVRAAGLEESATAGAIETAVKAAATAGAGNPDPSQFVPRAEFDRVSQRLKTVETERTEERVTAAVDEAVKAGKIAPAQRECATAYAKSDADGFAAFVKPSNVSEKAIHIALHYV